jgi:hypothetical protein
MRKYGSMLPFADNVIASFQTDAVHPGRVEGFLFAYDARVALTFDQRWVTGDYALLPLPGDRVMVRVTARPWVDGFGRITLRGKHVVVLRQRALVANETDSSEVKPNPSETKA